MTPLISFIVGSVLKVFAQGMGKWIEMKRTKDLLLSQASVEKIKALQSGEDKLSPGGKATRRTLALMIIGSWIILMGWVVIVRPDIQFIRTIPFTPGTLFSWITGASDLKTITESGGALLWMYFNVVMLVSGFYFTKIERGG